MQKSFKNNLKKKKKDGTKRNENKTKKNFL